MVLGKAMKYGLRCSALRLPAVVNLVISEPLNRSPDVMKGTSFTVGAGYAAHALLLLFLFLFPQAFL